MINYYTSDNGRLDPLDSIESGCWVSVIDPSPQEIKMLIDDFGLDSGFVKSSLDEEESSRIEREDDQTLIIVDTPVASTEEDETKVFYTMPIGIIITDENVFTISLHATQIIDEAVRGTIRNLRPTFKTRFVLQLLLRIAALFLYYLKQIDKLSSAAEQQLHDAMKNELLMQLLALEKSLVYFSTSLKANEATIEKIFRGRVIKLYDEDQDLLEDVLIEMKQAIEMSSIYSGILSSMMDGFSSVISNNLNIVMWRLTIVTILMEIPNIIFALYGINTVDLPLPFTWFPISLAVFLTAVAAVILIKWKKK
ncbi:magnesium transporter [Ruminococcus sp. YRD2003]|uniref:magnesium transporter CorA family protein n=1 Tax=Ruminococcus sp. YRD2003 TaxID=1452313 RepID=UPI0008BB82DC|nr:magnesium transporter CorA family protein [Ruminococcus sp.]SEL21846.1 magnesium transporter [Ruminococcus flavefaciens]